jgi:hypothetical protein
MLAPMAFGGAVFATVPTVVVHPIVVVHRSASSDWLIPSATGVGAAILGFLLALLLERSKRTLERRELDKSLLTMMEEEVATNLALLELNDELLTKELEVVDDGYAFSDALTEMQIGAWEAIRVDLPRWFPEHVSIFIAFRSLGVTGAQLNALIRERAHFRMHGTTSPEYSAVMREFDEALLEKNESRRQQLLELQEDLRALEVTIGLRKT